MNHKQLAANTGYELWLWTAIIRASVYALFSFSKTTNNFMNKFYASYCIWRPREFHFVAALVHINITVHSTPDNSNPR